MQGNSAAQAKTMRHGHILQELQVVCEAKAKGTKQGLAKDENRQGKEQPDHGRS